MFFKAVLLLAAAAAAPAAAEVPSAHIIVESWRHAVHAGPCKGIRHLRYAIHEDGLDGMLDEWLDGRGAFHRIEDRRLDRDEALLFRGEGTRTDWNGYNRTVDGDELKELTADAFAAQTLLCGPDKILESAAVDTDKAGALVLRVTPPGGEEIAWTVDPKTFLPLQSARASGEGDSVAMDYSDWRGPGTLAPHRLVMHDSDRSLASYTLNQNVRGTLEGLKTITINFSDVTMRQDALEFPFEMVASHIVFPVGLDANQPGNFLLDTGDGHESINSARLKALGLATYGDTGISGGGNQVSNAFIKSIDLVFPDGVILNHQHADAFDMTGLEHVFGVKLDGILGYDFLSRFVIEIDYQKKIMRLHKPDWVYAGEGVRFPITFNDGIPFGDATLDLPGHPALPAHVVMDFGAAETMTFTAPFIAAHDLRNAIGTNAAVNRPAGVEKEFFAQSNSRGRLPALHLGALTERDIPVNLSANTGGAYGQGLFAATIGESIYSRYRVILDYPHRRIIFAPTAESAKPFAERKTFGLTLLAQGDDLHTYAVTAVRAGSPAAALDFQAKDEIVAFDGKPASAFSLSELREWLSAEGDHTLQVSRDGKVSAQKITVTLVSIDR